MWPRRNIVLCAKKGPYATHHSSLGWLRLAHSAASPFSFDDPSSSLATIVGVKEQERASFPPALLQADTRQTPWLSKPHSGANPSGLTPKQDDTSGFILMWAWKTCWCAAHGSSRQAQCVCSFPNQCCILNKNGSGSRINIFADFRPAHLVVLQQLLQGKQLCLRKGRHQSTSARGWLKKRRGQL